MATNQGMGRKDNPSGFPNTFHSNFFFENSTIATNETIFSAVGMLANAISSAPIAIRKKNHEISPTEHKVAELLEFGFNPNMTTFRFINAMEVLRNTTGAGYAIKELNRFGNLEYLWIMRTEHVQPVLERDSRELYYRVKEFGNETEIFLHNSLVVAVGHISDDGINPINPIKVLQSSLEYDREVKEFSINQMQNGLRANIAIKLNAELNADQLEEYKKILQQFKKSGILFLDNGKEVKELNRTSLIDPKVFDVERITIARVARVFNIPLSKFLNEGGGYNNVEQADLNYLKDTILPMARMYEQEFSKKLLTRKERMEGDKIKFSLNGFARGDMKARGDFYMKGVRSGWFCVDDIRDLEDKTPLPDGLGQEFFISKDLTPIRSLIEGVKKNE